MPETDIPLAIYLPADLDATDRGAWCGEALAELIADGVVERGESESWLALLDAAAAETLPDGASGVALLVSAAQPPTYLWVTLAQPAGAPTRLGDAVLDTQLEGSPLPPPGVASAGEVYQRTRRGWVEQAEGAPVFLQTSVTATTLTIPGLGATDVCMWFNSIDPVAADELQRTVAEIALSADLLTYLST